MSAPTREQWLGVTRDITTNVERMIGMLLDTPPEEASTTVDTEDAVTAYHLGYDAGCRAGFPRPPACPDWCDEKHGQTIMGEDDWESIDKRGIEVVRCHAHHVGEVAGKVGVEIVSDTTAERGKTPVTSEPVLSLDTSGEGMLSGTQARQLARLLIEAADELEFEILGGERGE